MNVDLEELAAIIEQLDKTEFTDFRYEQGDLKIRVRRGGYYSDGPEAAPGAPAAPAAQSAPVPAAAAAAPAPAAPGTSERGTSGPSPAPPAPVPSPTANASAPAPAAAGAHGLDPENLPEGYVAVTAPMLGSFYAAPKPGEPPFVSVGDTVGPDSVVCIVEVMKLMNSVTAGASGEVAAVFAGNGDLVEFGQALFALKATA